MKELTVNIILKSAENDQLYRVLWISPDRVEIYIFNMTTLEMPSIALYSGIQNQINDGVLSIEKTDPYLTIMVENELNETEIKVRDKIWELMKEAVCDEPRISTFQCPYCGFSYKRKGSIPKEKLFSGQIRVVDYGIKWKEKVVMLLKEGLSPHRIARDIHCGVPTVLTFGIEHGLLPPELHIKRYSYIPISPTQIQVKPDFNAP